MNRPFKTYNGGKNGSGVYQGIINQIPPHQIFISGFAGNCGVLSNIKRAPLASYAIDADIKVIAGWQNISGITAENCDVIKWLPEFLNGQSEEIGNTAHKYFIFLDPPYLSASRRSQAKLYDFEMTDPASHKKMLEMVKRIPFPVLITHYPCKLYDDALKDWRTVDIQGRTRNGMRTERLYMNYPAPTALHDYRYIGNDYREREIYRKSKKNMIAKFKRMPDLKRNFILSELKAAGII